MPRVIDKTNVVNSFEAAPDKLRAMLGNYTNSSLENVSFPSDNTNIEYISPQIEESNQLLIPKKKQRIYISGIESNFRDYLQWKNFVFSTIKTGGSFLDHTTDAPSFEVVNTFNKNYHRPLYEDFTKTIPSNQLINYNLFAYNFKNDVEVIKNIADIRTRFDGSPPSLDNVFDQIQNRLINYTGSVGEISTKQRNIFTLINQTEIDTGIIDDFPFVYNKDIYGQDFSLQSDFITFLRQHKKEKNLFQSIKRDLSSLNKSFLIGDQTSVVKIYDLLSLMTSTSHISFTENSDEIFLLSSGNINSSDSSERFVNQIDSVLFLQKMREFVKRGRDIESIFKQQSCEKFLLGYKIEKYLDRDVTSPIQTYYTTSNLPSLKDTQIKYGRKYIYKTKVLLGVLGSSYSYSNLIYTSSESELVNESGEIITSTPSDISQVASEKYYAYVDVNISPSFKILEYEIEPPDNYLRKVAFIDSPTTIPHVDVYGCVDKPMVNFRLMPRSFTYGQIGLQDYLDQDEITRVGTLRQSDVKIATLFEISGEKIVNPDYFTGTYEIYRMEKPPVNKSDFANYYLSTVDSSQAIWLNENESPMEANNINALFSDRIVPNRKYYYAFRSLTYHKTPSELSEVYEVELLKDSDEYKINMKLYNIPEAKQEVYKKSIKRIIRLVPNADRLTFNDSNSTSIDDVNLEELGSTQTANRLVDFNSPNNSRIFKMRVTSKHTGKKMDINIRVKLIKTAYN